MAYTVEKFNSWLDQQHHWRQRLGLIEGSFRCFPYHGLGHALTDLLFGLKLFWPTKKNLVMSSWGSPLLMPILQGFVKEGHTLIQKPPNEGFPELSKDLLSAVLVRDHCFTGEILSSNEDFQFLNDKRIPHIEIQHAWGWSRPAPPLPFGAQIRVIDAQRVIVIVGHRFRFMNHSAQVMDWSGLDWMNEVQECKDWSVEDQNLIETFESSIAQEAKMQCHRPSKRLFDRLLLEVKGVQGQFFLEHLLQSIKQNPLKSPGFEGRCETTNLSRWEGLYPWEWWGEQKLSEEAQLSLVSLSAHFLKNNLSFEQLNKIYLECRKQSIS